MKQVRLTPLTEEERKFSEENYPVLEWCIRTSKLEQDFQDIAYLAYLHAVKKWYARPDLRKWSFKTIVKQTLRSHISTERRKESKKIQTISLNELIPGTDALTYADTVTEENIRFLRQGEQMENKRKISYDMKVPEVAKLSGNRQISVDTETLVGFLDSDHRTMCIEYSDKKEAIKKASSFRSWKRGHKREDFNIFRFEEKVYVEKISIKKRGAK